MALKAQIETLDDVAEPLRTEYKETQDPQTKKTVYVLDIDGPVDPLPGVKTLKDEAARRRIDNTKLTDKVKKYEVLGDRDPNEIVALLDRIPELEAAAEGKLDDAKINTIVETRVKAKIAPLERELAQTKTRAQELEGEVGNFKKADTNRKISNSVSKAAREAKVQDTALDDIELYGERLFEVDESGNVVTKDGVGVTPGLSPKEWLHDMQAKRPHWWGPSAGGGAGGGRGAGGGAGGINPWTAENWNVTRQNEILKSDRKSAERMAAAAGTKIGGLKPAAKK